MPRFRRSLRLGAWLPLLAMSVWLGHPWAHALADADGEMAFALASGGERGAVQALSSPAGGESKAEEAHDCLLCAIGAQVDSASFAPAPVCALQNFELIALPSADGFHLAVVLGNRAGRAPPALV